MTTFIYFCWFFLLNKLCCRYFVEFYVMKVAHLLQKWRQSKTKKLFFPRLRNQLKNLKLKGKNLASNVIFVPRIQSSVHKHHQIMHWKGQKGTYKKHNKDDFNQFDKILTLVDMGADEYRITEFYPGWYGGRRIPYYGISLGSTKVISCNSIRFILLLIKLYST